jgi:glucose-1-phosphate adenylyltransferase
MGIYVFGLGTLSQVLTEDERRRDSSRDFGKDVIPRMVAGGMRVFGYRFMGYWVDVGTIDAYWRTHMDLLDDPPPFDLNDRSWVIHTRSEERPPVRILEGAVVRDSMITDGCVIAPGAVVEKSVLSPGVTIGEKAVVRESIVLTDTLVGAGAKVERAVIDKAVQVGRSARIGEIGKGQPAITTIGKNARVAERAVVPRGGVVEAETLFS